MKMHARTSGFTLIEVLLVVVLTAMLMYGMGQIFKMASDVIGSSEAEVETRQKARAIFDRLEMDMQCLLLDDSGNYFEIKPGTMNVDGVERISDKLRLITAVKYNPEGLPGRMDMTQVSYKLLPENAAVALLTRKQVPFMESEAPLLVRTSLTYVDREMLNIFKARYPDYDLRLYTKPVMGDDPDMFQQYEDIIAGRVYDFSVEALDNVAVSRLPDLAKQNDQTCCFFAPATKHQLSKRLPRQAAFLNFLSSPKATNGWPRS